MLSDRRRAIPALAAALALVFGASACRKQPEVPLELKLTLIRTKLKPHDAIWYVLEGKNVGVKPLMILDEFWREQRFLSRNCAINNSSTTFEIIGPDGKAVECNFGFFGDHGEFNFWTNSRGTFRVELQGGETTMATPSIIAPIRDNPHFDFRAGPIPARRHEWMASLKADRAKGQDADWPEWARVPFERPVWVPAEARILQGYDPVVPGKYKIRVVYKAGNEVAAARARATGREGIPGFPDETTAFVYYSSWLEFEVAP